MDDQRIFLSDEFSGDDTFVLAAAAASPATAPKDGATAPHRVLKDRLKPNNRWRAFLEQRHKA